MHLFLIRHGQSYVNLTDWPHGYIDAGLTPLGERQSALLGSWLKDRVRPRALYASTLRRGAETAERLGSVVGLPVLLDDRLREVGNCWPDGSPVPPSAMPLTFCGAPGSTRPDDPVCEGTESWVMFLARVRSFVEEALARHAADAQLLVVCHSGVIEAINDHAFGVRSPRSAELSIYNTAITHWEHRDGLPAEPWLLHGHNLVYHLFTGADALGHLSGAETHWAAPERSGPCSLGAVSCTQA